MPEEQLLVGARLHAERVPAVVASIAEREGPAAAIAAAAPIAEVSRHPDLVAALIAAAESLGTPRRPRSWRTPGRAEAALAKLDG